MDIQKVLEDIIYRAVVRALGEQSAPLPPEHPTDEWGFRTDWGFATAIVQLDGGHAYAFIKDNKAGKPEFGNIINSTFPAGTIMQVKYPFIDGDGDFDAWRIWGWVKPDGSMSTKWQNEFINKKTTKVLEKYL